MKRRILVVEDHVDTLVVMAKLLSMRGYLVFSAESLQQARTHLQSQHIDLLICDVTLSDGNGLDLLKETTAKGIVMSGWEDLAASLKAGFHYHVLKPVDPMQLQELIASLLPIDQV